MRFLNEVIYQLFNEEACLSAIQPIGGGCIHQAGVFEYKGKKYFIKWNPNAAEMFETESKGLSLLGQTSTVQTPLVVGTGCADGVDYLCLEFVKQSNPSKNFWSDFGQQLADLHRNSEAYFGLDHNNFIGSLPQSNQKHQDWNEFLISERLIPQLEMVSNKGLVDSSLNANFESLFAKLPELIPQEPSALLHGDLWSGNFLVGAEGQPVFFDPAVYYGHREAELAFTRMFGGFDEEFYRSYLESFPTQSGYKERVDIFNLYPLLVHVNLFGASYLSSIRQTLSRFA